MSSRSSRRSRRRYPPCTRPAKRTGISAPGRFEWATVASRSSCRRRASRRGPGRRAGIRHTGAPLRDVAFCSGGTLEGHEGGPANDVYAFAGLTHWLVSGELPVGHVDVSAAAQGPLRELRAGRRRRPRRDTRGPTAHGRAPGGLVANCQAHAGEHAARRRRLGHPLRAERTNVPDAGARQSGAPAESAAADFRADPRRARGGSAAGLSAPNTPYSAGAGPTPQARPGQAPWNPPGPEARPEGRQLSTVLTLLLVVGGLFVLSAPCHRRRRMGNPR